jgi:hypothetical protein
MDALPAERPPAYGHQDEVLMHPFQVIALWLTVPAIAGVVLMGYAAFSGLASQEAAERSWPLLQWGLGLGGASMALAMGLAIVGGRLHVRRGGPRYSTDWSEWRPLGIGLLSLIAGGLLFRLGIETGSFGGFMACAILGLFVMWKGIGSMVSTTRPH